MCSSKPGYSNLSDIVSRSATPLPWSEGDNIPWHDPGFSKRMLREHLSQKHDAASRRFKTIDRHVHWIHHQLLSARPTRILDLGCGPGLYTSRFARLGHDCVGIDYSPASIAYAAERATQEKLHCRYLHQDIRTADYGSGFGLVMLIFGEFNVFNPAGAWLILQKAHRALAAGGLVLLEPHTFSAIQRRGQSPSSWYSAKRDLFSGQPHLCLQENFWDAASCTSTIRYFVVDASTARVTRYAQSFQAYTRDQYRSLLLECGFTEIESYPSLTGAPDEAMADFFVLVGRKSTNTD
jgi:SAM-dependent methyltransferase